MADGRRSTNTDMHISYTAAGIEKYTQPRDRMALVSWNACTRHRFSTGGPLAGYGRPFRICALDWSVHNPRLGRPGFAAKTQIQDTSPHRSFYGGVVDIARFDSSTGLFLERQLYPFFTYVEGNHQQRPDA